MNDSIFINGKEFKKTLVSDNYYISYGGRMKTLNIMDYLYNNCNIYLERKYKKYERLKSTL